MVLCKNEGKGVEKETNSYDASFLFHGFATGKTMIWISEIADFVLIFAPYNLKMELGHYYTSCCVGEHQCKCFNALSKEEHEFLKENSVWVRYRPKEKIFKQGGLVSNVMVVESGLVKVYLEDAKNTLVLKIVTGQNLVGLTSLSEEVNTYQYNASAYVETVVRQIDIRAFRKVIKENALFANEIIEILNSNSIQINGRFFCLSYKQSFGRVADILLCLGERVFKSNEFELPLSRKELAELTGLKPETVIRILKQFVNEKMIAIDNKKLQILDPVMLRKISDNG